MHFPLCGLVLASGPQPGDFPLRCRPYCTAHSSALNFAVYLFASEIKATLVCSTSSGFISARRSLPGREHIYIWRYLVTRLPLILLVLILLFAMFSSSLCFSSIILDALTQISCFVFILNNYLTLCHLGFLPGERASLVR